LETLRCNKRRKEPEGTRNHYRMAAAHGHSAVVHRPIIPPALTANNQPNNHELKAQEVEPLPGSEPGRGHPDLVLGYPASLFTLRLGRIRQTHLGQFQTAKHCTFSSRPHLPNGDSYRRLYIPPTKSLG
jgi:plasmid stability protein